ncbi:MAG: GAF domain-containing protein, partial [Candidatus Eiseniibacteriota bacterium]
MGIKKKTRRARARSAAASTIKRETASRNDVVSTGNSLLQKRTEGQLAVRDDLADLLGSIEVAAVVLDSDLCVEGITETAARLLGLNASAVGRPLRQVSESAFGEELESGAAHARKHASTIETDVRAQDGSWYLVRYFPYPARDEVTTGLVITFTDVTRLKGSQQELWGERDVLRNILDSMGEGVYIANSDFDIEYVNTTLQRDFGPYRGQKCYEYLQGRSTECPWCKNEEVLAGRSARWEWRFSKTGRTYDLMETPLLNADGSVSKLAIFRDISERKQAQEAQEKLLHELGERVKELQCMYGTFRSIRGRESLEDIFRDVAALIPPGWQYPEITRGKVLFEGREYTSEPFEETAWKQSSEIIVNGTPSGAVEVYYLESRPELDEGPFLKEERSLIDNLAVTLSQAVEHRRAIEELTRELAVSQALAELSNALIADPSSSIEEVSTMVVDYAKGLTKSEHGYVSSIDPKTGDNVAHTHTAMMKGQCLVTGDERRIAFPIGPDGRYPALWGHTLNVRKPLYTNSPRKHEASQGTPKGHIRIKNFLSVPAVVGGELIGQVSLANKHGDYTERDQHTITRLTELYAFAVQRKRAEEERAQLARFPSENPNPVLRIATDGAILYCNEAGRPLLDVWMCAEGQPLTGRWHNLVVKIAH